MYGLHRVNHMYTANGTGRDAVVVDPYFRGGRIGFEKMAQHQGAGGKDNAHRPEPENKHKYRAFDSKTNALQTDKLHMTLARSLSRLGGRVQEDQKRIRDAGQRALNGATAHLGRSVSAENLAVPFVRKTALVEQSVGRPAPKVVEPPSIFEKVQKEGVRWEAGDAKKYGFNGYSRTTYGGLWKR
mmetsp:Transcript_21507/g.54164  ORF Transcript_21507/g.54164 Transcript_21507/m.54164 type:complete len:185 (+) Transcript_21507:112-666(+)|eukprot:g14154.t1